MKKLVFLHGKGENKNSYTDCMTNVAKYCGYELVCFEAPIAYEKRPGTYQWFKKFENDGRCDAIISDYEYSLRYIKDKILALNCDTKDIVLVGHSQGGGMAVHVGLKMNVAGVVAICADIPYNISHMFKPCYKTSVYWFEAANDTILDANRKKSYKLLPDGVSLHYTVLQHCGHNDFENDFMKVIKNNEIEFLHKNTR